jgi:hypothetical protein|nr:MAG TPA: hypothetical protein [Caudoviricetes sp.]
MAKTLIGNIKGKDGRGISSISKTNTTGVVDTYTITYTDDTTSTFTINNSDSISLQRQIVPSAAVESSATASQAYAAGDYVVVSGVLRKVTAAIAKGDTIGDSNSAATTVSGELAGKAQIVPIQFTISETVDDKEISGVYIGGYALINIMFVTKNQFDWTAMQDLEIATADNIKFVKGANVVAASSAADEHAAHRLFCVKEGGDAVYLRHTANVSDPASTWNMATLITRAELK